MKNEKAPEVWEPLTNGKIVAPEHDFYHSPLGKPKHVYPYYLKDGLPMNYVQARYIDSSGKKAYRPWVYGILNEKKGWYCRGPLSPLNLYNLHKIYANPDATIIVVEGEKACEKAPNLGSGYVLTTSGSATSAKKVDWTSLAGRDVVIFRDNDEPGKKYESAVAKQLEGIASNIRAVQIPSFFPKGWDLGDELPAEFSVGQLFQLLRNSKEVTRLKKNRKKIKPDEIIEFVKNWSAGMFLDQYDKPFVQIPLRCGYFVCLPLRSSYFATLLKGNLYREKQCVVSRAVLDEVLDCIEGMILGAGTSHSLSVRVASKDDEFYYDLGYAAMRVNSKGCSLEQNPPPLFKRYNGLFKDQARLCDERVDLKKLLEFVNIQSKDEELLILVFLVSSYVPGIAHPLLSVYGPQGAAKSTLIRFLARLIDPCSTEDLQIHDLKELIQAAEHRYLLPLDNLSIIKKSVSDVLCKFVTGIGFSKRQLFSDDNDVVRAFRNVILVNGIEQVCSEPDLLDRSIVIGLQRILPGRRKSENQLNSLFDEMRPKLVSAIFKTLSNALKYLPEAEKIENLPRMADFAIYGCAIAKALGYTFNDFLSAYQNNIEKQHQEIVFSHPLAAAITSILRAEGSLSCTPTGLFIKVTQAWDRIGLGHDDKPGGVRSFGRQLSSITPNLEALGYSVSRTKSGDRKITISSPNVHHDQTLEKMPYQLVCQSFVESKDKLEMGIKGVKGDSIQSSLGGNNV